jgi:ribosome-binding protein aMBF1 (putative translation factor)
MRVQGKIWKDKNVWLIEVPTMDLMTQGKTRKDAFEMLKDAIKSLQTKTQFSIKFKESDHQDFYISTPDTKEMVAFILFRLRSKSGLSLEDVRERLGVKSKNAYAQYEQGRAEPTLSKMEELLKVLDCSLILNAA